MHSMHKLTNDNPLRIQNNALYLAGVNTSIFIGYHEKGTESHSQLKVKILALLKHT